MKLPAKFIIAVLLVSALVGAGVFIAKAVPEAEDFTPLGSGDPIWMTTMSNGGTVVVSYYVLGDSTYFEVNYWELHGSPFTYYSRLPYLPSNIIVAGCGNFVTIAAGRENQLDQTTPALFYTQVKLPVKLPCNVISGNLPIVYK